jgi:hypothetical protein
MEVEKLAGCVMLHNITVFLFTLRVQRRIGSGRTLGLAIMPSSGII